MTDNNNKMTGQDTNKLIEQRKAKLAAQREQGIAYPNEFRRDAFTADLRAKYGDKQKDELKIVDATIIKKIEDIEKSLEIILNFEISNGANYIDITKLINDKNIIININNAFIKRKEFILQKKSEKISKIQ